MVSALEARDGIGLPLLRWYLDGSVHFLLIDGRAWRRQHEVPLHSGVLDTATEWPF